MPYNLATDNFHTKKLRAFPVAAAELWNSLPDSVVSVDSITTFRRHLKRTLSVPEVLPGRYSMTSVL